ncbi:MAG: hypothetical protein HFG70_13645 [Hungatella sp.]|jgi:hypothetical protein|nr:hypothetical protein [Hungatella sp.]
MRAADNGTVCCGHDAGGYSAGDEYLSGAEIGNETVDQALAESESIVEEVDIL